MIFVQGDFCSSLRGHLAPSGDILGFLGGSGVKNLPANAGDVGSISGSQEDPLEKEMTTHSSIHGQRRLVGYSPWNLKRTGQDLVTKH